MTKPSVQRPSLKCAQSLLLLLLLAVGGGLRAATVEPRVLEIGDGPQWFIDDHVVDNRWATRHTTEALTRIAQAPKKHTGNPLIADDGGYVNVCREERTGTFRMCYQVYWDISLKPRKYTYAILNPFPPQIQFPSNHLSAQVAVYSL